MEVAFRLKYGKGNHKGTVQGIISHNSKSKFWSTGISRLHKDYWCKRTRTILPAADEAFYPGFHAQMNLMLLNQTQELKKRYYQLVMEGEAPKAITPAFIYDTSIGKGSRQGEKVVLKPNTLLEAFAAFVEHKRVEVKKTSIDTIKSNLKIVAKMQDVFKIEYTLEDLSLNFLHQVKKFIVENGGKPGYVKGACSAIRQSIDFFNKKGWTNVQDHTQFRVVVPRVDKPLLTPSEVEEFYRIDVASVSDEFIRDLFVFRCLMGFRQNDSLNAFKSITQVGDKYVMDMITQKRQKRATMELPALAAEIYLKYKDNYQRRDYGVSNHNKKLKQFGFHAQMNRTVSVLSEDGMNIEQTELYNTMSTHMAPRTCITNLLESGVPIHQVGKMVGKDIRTISNNYYNPNHISKFQ